jgi:transposase-like protein
MTTYGEYETPEGVEVAARQPANCPYCGRSPAFDGLGQCGDGYRHRCPDCGLHFVTFVPDELD